MADDRLDELDYYTLLQIPQEARADEIRQAFHRFALRYHPDRHVGGSVEKLERAAQIYRRGAEAYRVLLDPDTRHGYDRQLEGGRLRYDPADDTRSTRPPRPTTGKLQVRSPRARPFASRAEEAIRKADWRTARLNLQIALNHEPDNPLLEARLADVEARLRK